MGSLEIHVDSAEFRNKLETKINEIPGRTINLIDDISDVVEAYMRDESPVRFGDLQNSHTTEVLSDLERWIGPTVKHAEYVVKGTRPHWIQGKAGPSYLGTQIHRGGMLYWPGAKHPVWRVHHPGTHPNDYITRARERSEGRSSQLIQEFLGWLTE